MRTGLAAALLLIAACASGDGPQGADLSGFDTARITINGQEFEVWLAETFAQQQQGLMFASAEQLAPLPDGTERGMLFVFASEGTRAFFMQNTFVPLDLAYATGDRMIVERHELVPLDETPVVSGQPVQFALEVFRGKLDEHGIDVGTVIEIPAGVIE